MADFMLEIVARGTRTTTSQFPPPSMADTVHGKRQRIPSSKLASADNVGEFELNSHRDVRERTAHASAVNPATASSSRTPISTRLGSVTLEEEDDPEASGLSDSSKCPPRKKKRTTHM